MTNISERPENLRREISRFGLAALVLNGFIGAGIFVIPASAAALSGAFSPMMFAICGVLMTTIVASFMQVASYFKNTGGPVLYTQTAFGSFAGFQTGWLLYLGRVTAFAANTNILVDYSTHFWSGMGSGIGRIISIALVCSFFTWINVIGVKRGTGATNALTFLKLIPMFLFIGVGIFYVQPNLIVSAAPPELNKFSMTLLLLVYAYVGFEGAMIPAGESKNPKRDIPRVLLTTIGLTGLIYVLIQSVCLSVLPNLASSKKPLIDAANAMMGTPGVLIMTLAALFSIAGNLSAIMVVAPRMTYAIAMNKSLPRWFGAVNDSYKTPVNSIIFLGVLTFILAATGSFVKMALISSLARLIGFGICIAAIPTLKRKFGNSPDAVNLPGGYLIPALGFLLCVWLAAQAPTDAWLMTAAFVALGLVFYFISRFMNK